MTTDSEATTTDDEEFEYEAEREYLAYIAEAPSDVDRLELWHEDERVHVDPAKIAAVTAA